MDADRQMKQLAKAQKELEEQRQKLEAQKKQEAAVSKTVDSLVSSSTVKSPKELAELIISTYNINMATLRKPGTRRKRTTVTAELRDQIKDALRSGISKNGAAKEFNVSYAVIVKIAEGQYDHYRPRMMKKQGGKEQAA